jgi:hypothetical protein
MAWNNLKPENDAKLKEAPAMIRENFEAIELGTDPALQVTNDKVASNASIADTKLAKISTAGKVGGAALTELANIPSGAGIIPAANLPADNVKLTGDQTISSGVKTFSVSPIVPTPTTDYQAAPKKYIDDNAVKLTGNQTVAGIKTFSSFPVTPSSAPTANYEVANKKYVDDHAIVGASTQATGTTDIAGAGSEADMTNMSITLTTKGTKLLVIFSAPFANTASETTRSFLVYANIDGTNKRTIYGKISQNGYSNDVFPVTFQHLETGLTPGSHTVKIRWNTSADVYQYGATYSPRVLTVIDLP